MRDKENDCDEESDDGEIKKMMVMKGGDGDCDVGDEVSDGCPSFLSDDDAI